MDIQYHCRWLYPQKECCPGGEQVEMKVFELMLLRYLAQSINGSFVAHLEVVLVTQAVIHNSMYV